MVTMMDYEAQNPISGMIRRQSLDALHEEFYE